MSRGCEGCDRACLDSCFNDAIEPDPEGGIRILAAYCAGCGACVPACAAGRIYLDAGTACVTEAS